MKHFFIALTIIFLAMGTALATPSGEYSGTWKNVDTNTHGITKIVIHVGDSKNGLIYYVHVWGKCHPQDCDWGTETTNSYSDGHLTARYRNNFSVRDLTITKTGPNALEVKARTRFTDNSGRPATDNTYTFRRLVVQKPQTPKPMDRTTPKPMGKTYPKPSTSSGPTGKY